MQHIAHIVSYYGVVIIFKHETSTSCVTICFLECWLLTARAFKLSAYRTYMHIHPFAKPLGLFASHNTNIHSKTSTMLKTTPAKIQYSQFLKDWHGTASVCKKETWTCLDQRAQSQRYSKIFKDTAIRIFKSQAIKIWGPPTSSSCTGSSLRS